MKGWRTVAFNVLSFTSAFLAWDHLTAYVSAQHLLELSALVNFALRYITTTPVGGKEE